MIRPKDKANPTLVKQIFRDKSSEQLLAEWNTQIDSSTDFIVRESLLKEMTRRGIRPDTVVRERNIQTGIYPDISDPDFAARLSRKTEFSQFASTAVDEDTCTRSRESFETTAVQRLVARFLHPSTPYNGILLDHGVGVGKTCSAVTVAETFLEILPNNTVYIVVPQAIAEGFKSTIFDIEKLQPASKEHFHMTGERWVSPQCTGMTYLRLSGMEANESREEIARGAEKEIKRRYKIMGYLAFANWVKGKTDAIPSHITGVRRDDAVKKILMDLFSDHLIIIDEAHNLRDAEEDETDMSDEPDDSKQTDSKEGKKLTPILKDIVRIAEGLRLMLMTATPMYNTAPEIIFLLNLLLLNDTKDEYALLKSSDVFGKGNVLTQKGESELVRVLKRYVSYMRGENPNTFPLRLTPETPRSITSRFLDEYPTISASKTENTVKMTAMDKNIMEHLPFQIHSVESASPLGVALHKAMKREGEEPEAREVANLDAKIQLGNFVFPDGNFGEMGISSCFKTGTESIKGTKCTNYTWKHTEPIESVFLGDGLRGHSPKIANIVDSITRAKGISFVYSRYMKSGALPLAIALECAGWCRVLSDGTPAPLLKQKKKQPYKHYYILLTSDKTLSPDFKGLLKYATTFQSMEEAEGAKVKAILGSQIASEGLDLKCIREIHLLDGWYHLNRIEQITGRGIRFCSHTQLPLEKRNCLIYLHVVSIPEYETADLYMYRLAIKKAQPIGHITRLMKIHAWDCMLNIQAIQLHDLPTRRIEDAQGNVLEEYDLHDKPYTSFCDFSETCEYICGSKPMPDTRPNESTYKDYDFRKKFLDRQEVLAGIFSEEDVVRNVKQIQAMYEETMPRSMATIGLREALATLRIKRKDGIMGSLILTNGYVLFQPDQVTDTQIPMALRYGRAYGHIPRTFVPERGAILQSDIVVQESKAAPELEQDTSALRVKALRSLREWKSLYTRIIKEPFGSLSPPEGMTKESFLGWRWVYHHFRELPESESIAIQWWMDNAWTSEERSAVLNQWIVNSFETEEERVWRDVLLPNELVLTEELRGYRIVDAQTLQLQTYCSMEGTVGICTSMLATEVERRLPKPVNIQSEDTAPVFGFLTTKKKNVVFKTVDKNIENIRWEGAECQNTSNLNNHKERLRAIQQHITEQSPIRPFVLDDREETHPNKEDIQAKKKEIDARYKDKKPSMDSTQNITHIGHLSQKQICPYMEFLLRWLDKSRFQNVRWFLSLVDSARADVKME